ncbi:hypothetical protein [Nocardia lijiangensis]|uniref:hypothetical protein n=1 Tax=Nocardia lijiangensis TaxID=299618 RepID=UPI000830CE7A|nr:hypothetical protein [Nocardia lijiangensis]
MTESLAPPSFWPLALFRAVTAAQAALVLSQAFLAGEFLSGHFEALAAHGRNGGFVALAMAVQTLAAILLWRRGSGPSWPVRTSVVQTIVAGALIPLGEQRVLAVHVPLAVGLAIGTALLTVWAWRWRA